MRWAIGRAPRLTERRSRGKGNLEQVEQIADNPSVPSPTFMLHDSLGEIETRSAVRRRGAGGAFAAFLFGSLVVHAAVIAHFPGPAAESSPPALSSLEIVMLQPTVLPSMAPAAAPVRHGMKQATPPRLRATAQARSERAMPEPVFTPRVEPLESPAALDHPEPGSAPERPSPAASASLAPTAYQAAYLSTPAPRYPEAARLSGEQGMVTLRVRVARDGAASSVTVEKSSGSPHLDAAALEAVKAWRFAPARRGQEAVESWMLIPIVFRLDRASWNGRPGARSHP